MRIVTVRKGLAALAALVVLALLAVFALPWVASTQIVRDRIAYELGLWSGYRVSLGAAPVLDVWPGFKATLDNVAFYDWSSDWADDWTNEPAGRDRPPVLEAERLEITLSPLAALRGNIVFSAMSVHRPLLPASPGGGRMVRAVEAARRVVADNPASPDAAAVPDIAFGTVEFFDGRIADAGGDVVTSLRGRIAWPSLNRTARVTASGIWRGENVSVEVSAAAPLLLMAGGQSAVGASLKSTLVEASFEGAASFAGDGYFDGPAKLASPSIRRMLEWSRIRIAPGAAIGTMALSARLQGNARRLRLDQTAVTLGDNTGRGVLDLAFSDPVPAISGTLAFDKLDLRSFLMAFAPSASGTGSLDDRIDTAFSEQLSVDLRLSAAAATLGAIPLADIAASTQIKGTLAAFDISDAAVFGGEVQAGLRIEGAGADKTVEMRLNATDIDALAFARAAGATRLMPQGRAAVSLMLRGAGSDWNTVLGHAEGTVSASLGQGALAGFDLARFRALWEAGGFFPLAEVAGGTLPLRGADLRARIVNGVARIEKADFMLDQQAVLQLAGVVNYLGRALTLSGHFAKPGPEGERDDISTPFFVGGAWDAPFVSPAATE
jgi:AsmA protein